VRDLTDQYIAGERLEATQAELKASEAKWRGLFEELKEGFILGGLSETIAAASSTGPTRRSTMPGTTLSALSEAQLSAGRSVKSFQGSRTSE